MSREAEHEILPLLNAEFLHSGLAKLFSMGYSPGSTHTCIRQLLRLGVGVCSVACIQFLPEENVDNDRLW